MFHYVLALFFILNFPGAAADTVDSAVVERAQQSVVLVVTDSSWCTGFVVGITRVITAEHCVNDDKPVQVDGLPAKVIRYKDQLALIETLVLPKPAIPVAKSWPRQGDPVASLGHAFGGPSLVYQRQVAGYALWGDMLLDGVISPGMSGGPVINVAGEVVAVNEATNQHIGAATRGAQLRKFLGWHD